MAYLRGDISIAEEACKGILRLDPNDLYAMNCNGLVQQLHGELDEAANSYTRMIEVATDQEDERWRAAATGNLGTVYRIRGDLDEAERVFRKGTQSIREARATRRRGCRVRQSCRGLRSTR